jgi:hypothetical protein
VSLPKSLVVVQPHPALASPIGTIRRDVAIYRHALTRHKQHGDLARVPVSFMVLDLPARHRQLAVNICGRVNADAASRLGDIG